APAEAPLGRGVERDLHLPGAGARRGLLSSWLQDPVAGAGGGTAFRDRRAPRRGGPLRDQHLGALPRRGGAVAYREPPDRAGGGRGESWGESGTSPRGVGAFRGTFGPPGAHAGARARRVPSHPPVSVHEEHTMAAKKASSATARAATPRATSTTKPASGRRASARPAGNAAESARGKSKASSAARAARSSAPSKQASIKASATTGAAKKTATKTTAKKVTVTSAARTKPAAAKKAPTRSAPSDAAVSELQEGQRAPSFALQDQQGAWVRSEELAGAPYVLYFYPKDNTPGCTREACDFRDAFGAFKRSKIRVFGVSPDSAKSHAGFAAKYELPFPLLVDADKELASAYG